MTQRQADYDAIVIGSGIGGATAAAVLAKVGKKVFVAEQADEAGGYAHAFRRGPYLFDPAVHATAQGQDGRFIDLLLRYLGVRDRCELLPVDSFYTASFPDLTFRAPSGTAELVAAHTDAFPEHADGLRAFFELCSEVHRQAHQMPPQLSLRELDEAARTFPLLFRYQKATAAEVLDEHVSDARVKAVCAASWPYLGVPPSQLSFVVLAQMFNVHGEGSYYCRGSFQSLIDALIAALEQHGGTLSTSTRVERILLEGSRATGVRLVGGEEIRAKAVISNADATTTLERLVGEEHLPRPYLRKLRRMSPSVSAFVVFAVTDADLAPLDLDHETFVHLHWDHDATFQDVLQHRPGAIWINVPTLVDPTLAPPGEHLVIISCLASFDSERGWMEREEAFAGELVVCTEKVIPAVAGRLRIIDTASPATFLRFTGNTGGAAYGWANTPNQVASRRLGHVTPIDGLYLSGHWTQPGANSIRVLLSGLHTAQIALARAGEPIPQIEPEDQLARAW